VALALPARFGDYQLIARLGGGGMGDVHLARPLDTTIGIPTPVVIKRLHAELAGQEEFVLRFHHEAAVARRIQSKHITKVYDAGEVDDVLYICMEHVNGWPLDRVIRDLNSWDQKVSVSSIIDVTVGILEGLHALHDARGDDGASLGLVHRDISPKNVMLDERCVPHLIDLGLGRSKLQEWKTGPGVILGSPGYMPPEQVLGKETDHRADVYAVGVILMELLTLTPYIRRGSMAAMLMEQAEPNFRPPSFTRPDVPAALDAIEQRALAIDPNERFLSARAFIDALTAARLSMPVDPSQSSLLDRMNPTELLESKTQITAMVRNAEAATHVGPKPSSNPPPVPRADSMPATLQSHPALLSPTPMPMAMPMPMPDPAYVNVSTQVGSSMSSSVIVTPAPRRTPLWPIVLGLVALTVTFAAGLYLGRAEKVVTIDSNTIAEESSEVAEPGMPGAVEKEMPGAVGGSPAPSEPDGKPQADEPPSGAPAGAANAAARATPPSAGAPAEDPTTPPPTVADPPPQAAPASTTVASMQAKIDGLTERARRLMSELPAGSSDRAETMNTLRNLMRRRASPRLLEMRSEIDEIERTIERLESGE